MRSIASPSSQAIERIAGFAALLREHGVGVGVAEQQAMVRSALVLPATQPARIEAAWRAIACHRLADWQRWPELFQRYWYPDRVRGSTRVSGQVRHRPGLPQVVQALQQRLGDGNVPAPSAPDTALQAGETPPGEPAAHRAQGGASRTEALHDRSLSQWLPQDLALLERLAERIAQALQRRLTRRWHDTPAGRRLDLRRTLRRSLATGGVPLHPAWRAPRRERPRLFILVDVSRSMETHAQLFLRIARAFVAVMQARVFVFHTRLAEVTPLLRSRSAAVQDKVNAVTAGFGGGTRIATSLGDFHTTYARAQLGREARVWILSDGFDADAPHRLADALARVRAHGARVDWFHPSAHPPASQAMQEARGRPGLIARFHRLDSLGDLARLAATPWH